MNKFIQKLKYFIFDYLAAFLAWALFFAYRKIVIESTKHGMAIPMEFDTNFYLGLLIIPLFWVSAYYFTGFYRNIYRRSRLKELVQTLNASFFGVLLLFFVMLLDDSVYSYKAYYYSFSTLFFLHFFLTLTFRLILSTITNKRIQRREIGFNTILVGSNQKAANLYREIEEAKESEGYLFKGYVTVYDDSSNSLNGVLPHLGKYSDLKEIIREQKIEDVIIAIESSEHHLINEIINKLEGEPVHLKIIPDMYDIISGTVRMNNILGAPLIDIRTEIMPQWQQTVKRGMDIVISLLALIIGSPVYLAIAITIKLTTKGPVFFLQQRIGLHGKPFNIIKFRTMKVDAEANGPMLSSSKDSRITKAGRFLRKVRLDEIPQFYNVLKGEMSLVGPRPERTFFIEQIIKIAPHYTHLHKVRPGITSWGQVKYGYAENVDEMVERLKFDVLYIENMSLALDIKILIYTILIMVQGRGK